MYDLFENHIVGFPTRRLNFEIILRWNLSNESRFGLESLVTFLLKMYCMGEHRQDTHNTPKLKLQCKNVCVRAIPERNN